MYESKSDLCFLLRAKESFSAAAAAAAVFFLLFTPFECSSILIASHFPTMHIIVPKCVIYHFIVRTKRMNAVHQHSRNVSAFVMAVLKYSGDAATGGGNGDCVGFFPFRSHGIVFFFHLFK